MRLAVADGALYRAARPGAGVWAPLPIAYTVPNTSAVCVATQNGTGCAGAAWLPSQVKPINVTLV